MSTQTTLQKMNSVPPAEVPTWLDRGLFPFASRYLSIEGQRLHYIDEGQGPTILFLHANPLWSFTYREIIKELRSDFRCVAFDFPGFGLSELNDEWVHSLTADSRLVERFIQALDIRDVILYGHDASCSIGLGVVARQPERFRAAVVSNSFAWPIEQYASVRRFVGIAGSKPFGFLINNFSMLVKYTTDNAFFANGRKMSAAERAAYLGPFEDRRRRRVQGELFRSILASHDYLQDLEIRLKTMPEFPVLILFGDDDATFQAGWHQRFEQIFPNHLTVILEGGHHFPSEFDPARIVRALREWYPSLN